MYLTEIAGSASNELARGQRPLSGGTSQATDLSGVASFTFLTFPGTWEVKIFGGSLFTTFTDTFEITAGQANYEIYADLEPKGQRSSLPSNKYLNQQGRLVHIRVVGSKRGKEVPVPNAAIFDNSGSKIATTGANGAAVVKHKEAIGETVTLRAEPPATPGSEPEWQPGSASFIVGAVEKGLRTTRSEDYVTIVLGSSGQTSEKHPLDVTVRGMKNGKRMRIANASILDAEGHKLGTTDSLGQATVIVEVPLGETYSVKAEAKHWKPASETLQSGMMQSGVTPTYAHETVEFMLQPAQETCTLTVEVLDRTTDKPLSGATVTLYKPNKFPGTEIDRTSTNDAGEATFDAESLDRAMLNGAARIEATYTGHKPSVETVSENLTTGESPRYVVYLTEIQSIWSGTWRSLDYTMGVYGGGGSIGYKYRKDNGQDEGQGNCSVKGNVATCKWAGHWHDADKDINRQGTATMKISGDAIEIEQIEGNDSYDFHPPSLCQSDPAPCTEMHKGKIFTGTYIRKK